MNIEKVKADLLTAANAIYWGARRVTDWECDYLDVHPHTYVVVLAMFDYGDFKSRISITVGMEKPDLWLLEIKLGDGSTGRISHQPHENVAAGLTIALSDLMRQLHPMFMDARSRETTPKYGFHKLPTLASIYYPHHADPDYAPEADPDQAPEADPEETLKQRACTDCRHFTYLRMDPYCNLHYRATEHDKHCRDFAFPAPKSLTPQK